MKQLADAHAAAERKKAKRQWHWCRRDNGFSDMPIWKLVARRCNTSLVTVLAFVNRLEELANNAGNVEGRERGSVETFDAEEFSLALDIPTEEAARIFAALEDDKVNWIAFNHLVTFYDRNKDREEDAESVRARKRRSRSYERIREQLARLCRLGKATADQRLAIEVSLKGISDAELKELQNELARAELSADGLSTGGHRSALSTEGYRLETSRLARSHRSQSDTVTVTPEERTNLEQTREKTSAVDNSGDVARGATGGLAKGAGGESAETSEQATSWIDSAGKRLLVERLTIHTNVATTHVERWRRDLQDDVALKAIMVSANERAKTGAHFHVIIGDAVRREIALRENGRPLGLMPPRPGSQPKGPEADLGHNVTSSPVDNLKRSAS